MNICLICLRTDKVLKLASTVLEDFHDEMCDFTFSTVSLSLYYCSECEYLLTKFYKFREKCLNAIKVYRKWKTLTTKKHPLRLLHTLLPQPHLSLWTPHPDSTYIIQETDVQTYIDGEELINEIIVTNVKIEDDPCYNGYDIDTGPVVHENVIIDVTNIKIEDDPCYNGNDIDTIPNREHDNFITDVTNIKSKDDPCYNGNDIDTIPNREHDNVITNVTNIKSKDDQCDNSNEIDTIPNREHCNVITDVTNIKSKGDPCYNGFDIVTITNREHDNVITDVPNIKSKDPCYNGYDFVTIPNRDHDYVTDITNVKSEDDPWCNGNSNDEQKQTKCATKVEQIDETANSETDEHFLFKNIDELLQFKPAKERKDRNKVNLIQGKITRKMRKKWRERFERMKKRDEKYSSLFDIEYLLSHEEKLEEFKKRARYVCYLTADYKCEICYQVLRSFKHLQYHTKKWHTEKAGYVLCPFCKIWSSIKARHYDTHLAVFKCKLCPLVTHQRDTMQNHFNWHKGNDLSCEQCNKLFKSRSAYNTHLGKFHRQGRHICQGCGRGFRSPLGLSAHKNKSSRCIMAREQSDVPKEATEGVRCDECDVTLLSQKAYCKHIRDIHEREERCADVAAGRPVTFGRPVTVNRNVTVSRPVTASAALPKPKPVRGAVKSSTRDRSKVICRLCNCVTHSWFQLTHHFKVDHPDEDVDLVYADSRTQLCDVCGAAFTSPTMLRSHMCLHTGARPFPCDLCPKRFRGSYLLWQHRVRHFPSTLTCKLCGKQFKTKGNLTGHMNTHRAERNHICLICGKGFVVPANLREHVRGVHHNIRRVRGGRAAGGGAGAVGGSRPKRRKKAVETDTDTDSGDGSE